ncbi:MAG: ABC transporter permease subunit [Thermodesulfobacteriota bacterium]
MRLITWLYLFYLVIPISLLFLGSFGESWTNQLFPSGFTLKWYYAVAIDPSFRRAFVTSLQVVVATCILDALLAVPLAYAIFASANRGVRSAARLVALLPIAAPPLVLGFGFILVFSSDVFPWLGSLWLLIAGHVVLTLPYLFQTLVGDMRHLGLVQLELAAESLGAGFAQRFLDIVLPSLRHSLASGLIMVAALSIGEFQISNLIAGFMSRTYPVVLLQAFYGATGFACAATVALLILALTAAWAGSITARSTARHAAGGRPAPILNPAGG